MPKPNTFPTLYNEVKQLKIASLKRDGYLEKNSHLEGVITWYINKNKTGSISIRVNTKDSRPYIELSYNYKDEPREYKVYLITKPSNLGKGEIWYFRCPHTHKLCTKLYCISGFFYHRTAFIGCMYESQTYSKRTRLIFSVYKPFFNSESNYKQLFKKNFKTQYAGKPTKRFLKLNAEIQRNEQFSVHDIESLFMMR